MAEGAAPSTGRHAKGPAMTNAAPPSLLQRLQQGMALGSLISTWTAGLLGCVVVWKLGPALAMGAQMYLAFNTEPVTPSVPFPGALAASLALLPLPLVARRRWGAASLSALPLFLLPWWQLVQLYRAAAGTPG